MKNTNFKIKAIDADNVKHLFDFTDKELKKINAIRQRVTAKPGFPCRVSLEDPEIGEEVILFPYNSFDIISPYTSKSPVFIRKNAITAQPDINEIPLMFTHRTLSLRGFDSKGMMLDARTIQGKELKRNLHAIFSDQNISFIHIHNSGPGCFNCYVDRVV